MGPITHLFSYKNNEKSAMPLLFSCILNKLIKLEPQYRNASNNPSGAYLLRGNFTWGLIRGGRLIKKTCISFSRKMTLKIGQMI